MGDQVLLAKLTRREFREALARGEFQTAIVPVGSNEQHLEHLAMEHDIASATHVAVAAAERLYPPSDRERADGGGHFRTPPWSTKAR